jgi:hypothetical protein
LTWPGVRIVISGLETDEVYIHSKPCKTGGPVAVKPKVVSNSQEETLKDEIPKHPKDLARKGADECAPEAIILEAADVNR